MDYVSWAMGIMFPPELPVSKRIVVNLVAYLDESGTHDDSRVLTLAAAIANPERWASFIPEWKAALVDEKVTRFHSTDCACGGGEYTGWPWPKRKAHFLRMYGIAYMHVMGAVEAVVPLESYSRIVEPTSSKNLAGPYGLATRIIFQNIVVALKQMKVQVEDPHFAYVLGEGTNGSGSVVDYWRKLTANRQTKKNWRMLSISLQGVDDFVPLQAADIWAYESWKSAYRMLRLPEARGYRDFNLELLRQTPDRWFVADDQVLEWWAKERDNPMNPAYPYWPTPVT